MSDAAASGVGELLLAQTTVVTVCLALVIWLGLLARPSRATLLWTLAFSIALLGTYGSIVAVSLGVDVVSHPVMVGLSAGTPTIIWSGLRAVKGKRTYAWIGFAQAAASVALLWSTTETPNNLLGVRLVFFGAGIGASVGAIEALRGSFRGSRFGIPLVAASGAMALIATIGLADTAGGLSADSSEVFMRATMVVRSAYCIGATVSLLFLSNRRAGASDILQAMDAMTPLPLLRGIVRERIRRARVRQERNWSFVELRLDEASDLRDATGEPSYIAVVSAFEKLIARVFPADADMGRLDSGRVVVFVALPVIAVRELARSVLEETARGQERPTAFHVSASAGITIVDPASDDFDSLLTAASTAAAAAQERGGNAVLLAADLDPTTRD